MNKNKIAKYSSDWKKTHRQSQNKTKRKYRKKIKDEAWFKITNKLRVYLWRVLKRKTIYKSKYEKMLGFSIIEIKNHFEKQFTKNMNWNNYGNYWEIDHIIPLCKFRYTSFSDKSLKKAWKLSNLRPLEKEKNIEGLIVLNKNRGR